MIKALVFLAIVAVAFGQLWDVGNTQDDHHTGPQHNDHTAMHAGANNKHDGASQQQHGSHGHHGQHTIAAQCVTCLETEGLFFEDAYYYSSRNALEVEMINDGDTPPEPTVEEFCAHETTLHDEWVGVYGGEEGFISNCKKQVGAVARYMNSHPESGDAATYNPFDIGARFCTSRKHCPRNTSLSHLPAASVADYPQCDACVQNEAVFVEDVKSFAQFYSVDYRSEEAADNFCTFEHRIHPTLIEGINAAGSTCQTQYNLVIGLAENVLSLDPYQLARQGCTAVQLCPAAPVDVEEQAN
jgi:hypothetical protein